MNSALWAGMSGCLAALAMAGCQREAAKDAVPPKAADAQQSATDIRSDPLRQAFFGELHLHTAYSLDAYIFGNTMNDPFVAYRFAQGEEVTFGQRRQEAHRQAAGLRRGHRPCRGTGRI